LAIELWNCTGEQLGYIDSYWTWDRGLWCNAASGAGREAEDLALFLA